MPSGCSKPALLAAALLLAAPVQANPWRLARFPVPQFSGYTSHFGWRANDSSPHRGLDIAAPLGSPVLSWWGGRVERLIDDESCGIGLAIHSGSYEHLYCHLQGSIEDGLLRSGAAVRLPRGNGSAPGRDWRQRPQQRSAPALGGQAQEPLAGPAGRAASNG